MVNNMAEETTDSYYVLGLDLGIANCGFALIDLNNPSILEMGAHLFDTPQEDGTKISLAKIRKNARSARRNNKRTKDRQKHCVRLLKEYELVPEGATKQWFQSCAGDRPILELRVKGLDSILTDREFSQVLYSLSKRRGYIPHGESDGKATDDTRNVLEALSDNDAKLRESKSRTVGEMLYKRGMSRNKEGKYENCVRNDQILDEVHKIFDAQRNLGNEKAKKKFEDDYIQILTWQKEVVDYDDEVYSRVGRCFYFPEEKRAAQANLSSELCRAYEQLGHLVMLDADGEERRLTFEQRNRYISRLFSIESKKVTYSFIRMDLDLDRKTLFKGINSNEESKREVTEPKTWRFLTKTLPENLLNKMLDDLNFADDITEALTFASSETSLKKKLFMLKLVEEESEAILSLPYFSKPFNGYVARSRKANYLLLDAFEDPDVLTLADAEEASGLQNRRLMNGNTNRQRLLLPYEEYDRTCTNPIVLRVIARMRRIINAIIRQYGVPHEIHIQIGKELKQSKNEKQTITRRNKANEAKNKAWSEEIARIRGCELEAVTNKNLLKYALWEQQEGKDVYTGKTISLERMILDDYYCEIDHILPYSRTYDDSRNNKVVVLAKTNQDKKERTPYEWMMQDKDKGAPSWDAYKARVLKNSHYSTKKKTAYLLQTNLDYAAEREFLSRNFNDPRCMFRAIKSYMEDTLQFPGRKNKTHVVEITGGVTASLRYAWDLDLGAEEMKEKFDDRHHAVDACVIAACSQNIIKKVTEVRSLGRETYKYLCKSHLADTQPWETFAEDVIVRYEDVIPTRMVSHGVTGLAFEETNYRFDGITDEKKRLARLVGNKKHRNIGNFVIGKDNNAHIVGGLAFLRLWLDPTARGGRGKWYAEPVYYADLPAIRNGSYVPKYAKAHLARHAWKSLPEEAMQQSPIVLFRGDVLKVNDKYVRYWSFHIGNAILTVRSLRTGEKINMFLPLGKWTKDTDVSVIQEDCLGHCYEGMPLDIC